MDSSISLEEQIIDILSTDSPLPTPSIVSPAPGNNNDKDERQVTTRVIVRGPARNAYVTVPESSPLLRDENNLPALMVNDTLPITDPRPLTLRFTISYQNHSPILIFVLFIFPI